MAIVRSGDWDNNNQNDLFAVDLDGNLRQVTAGKTTLGFGCEMHTCTSRVAA